MIKAVLLTRRSRDGAQRVADALKAGSPAMARSGNGNWFRVLDFRVERDGDYEIWFALSAPYGHLSGSPNGAWLQVQSVRLKLPEGR